MFIDQCFQVCLSKRKHAFFWYGFLGTSSVALIIRFTASSLSNGIYVYESNNTENIGFDKKIKKNKNKTRANKKNKLENQNQGKNQKKTKKKNKKKTTKNQKKIKTCIFRSFDFVLMFFLFFFCFFCFFCFFSSFFMFIPVDLFFWWFCFCFCFCFFLLKSTFSVLHGVINLCGGSWTGDVPKPTDSPLNMTNILDIVWGFIFRDSHIYIYIYI